MKVDDVGAHAVQKVLRVRDQHEDSLEPEEKEIELHRQHAPNVWANEAPKQEVNLRLELLFQPHTSIQVQMVCWLIE